MKNELRQDPLSRRWVIIAKKRAKRKHDVNAPKRYRTSSKSKTICPFCPGNENQSVEVYRQGPQKPASSWTIRSILNKAPYFEAPSEEKTGLITRGVIFRYTVPRGISEVLIENRDHKKDLVFMSEDEVTNVLSAYKDRFNDLDKKWNEILIFRNHGYLGGQTITHPHTQITAASNQNPEVLEEEKNVINFKKKYGLCLMGHTEKVERLRKKRLIMANDYFVAICPWASFQPYEIIIIPKKHKPNIGELTKPELKAFASILQDVLRKIYLGFSDPSYNFYIRNYKNKGKLKKAGHWYLRIILHLTMLGGYEASSGDSINPVSPEDATEHLKKISIKNWK